MGVAAPPPVPEGVLQRIAFDLRVMRETRGQYPAGDLGFSVARTRAFERDPLPLLLDCYARFGPVFTLRLLYAPVVFALGPEANHYITVSHASNFRWRDGSMGDLIPLLGDGLLTTDGEYHRRARRIMLPAFHREQIAAATGRHDRGVRPGPGGLARRPAPRSLRLDQAAGPAHRDAGAVRLRSRPQLRRTRHGRGVRADAGLLGPRVHHADAPRAGQSLAADAALAHSPGPRDLRRDRPAATERRARARTSSACCSTHATRTARRSRGPSCATR